MLPSLFKDFRKNLRFTLRPPVQKDEVELARINFEIDKKVRHKFKSKASAEGKQMREILVKLIEDYLNN